MNANFETCVTNHSYIKLRILGRRFTEIYVSAQPIFHKIWMSNQFLLIPNNFSGCKKVHTQSIGDAVSFLKQRKSSCRIFSSDSEFNCSISCACSIFTRICSAICLMVN
ncbi:unnamed protein product [Moneuplotes crassus]|uniref:Uncharacterized protein n=1 Tax=Euplotes crassus TaxID=5936 RepID=A0AAD1TZ11_EUPCR|nr:unnamed protein product [Moneuplotes crassus]